MLVDQAAGLEVLDDVPELIAGQAEIDFERADRHETVASMLRLLVDVLKNGVVACAHTGPFGLLVL